MESLRVVWECEIEWKFLSVFKEVSLSCSRTQPTRNLPAINKPLPAISQLRLPPPLINSYFKFVHSHHRPSNGGLEMAQSLLPASSYQNWQVP